MTKSYRIGVDGGGTKTECILVDEHGEIIARHLAPGCNPSQTGPDKARAILTAALDALLKESKIENPKSKIAATHLYLAGNRTFWNETATTLTDFGSVITAADSLPVLELATAGKPGLVLHAGTGSFIAARSADGTIHYSGGLGWKFGDPGSGFDIGQRATTLALLEMQSQTTTAASPLATALRAHTGLTDYASHSRFFYHDPAANHSIAAFAPRVIALAEAGDGTARQVITESITELVRQADQVLHRLFPPSPIGLPCGLSGRILTSQLGQSVMQALASNLNWPVTLEFIDQPPIEGVRRLLVKP